MMVLYSIMFGDVNQIDRPAAGHVGENTGGFAAERPVNAKTD